MYNKQIILELGCGTKKHKEAIGVDYVKFKGIDVQANLDYGLPFKADSASKIYISHVLEHLNYYTIMDEIYRVLKDGRGVIRITTPYFTNHRVHIGEHKIAGFSWIAFEHFKDPNHPMHKFEVIGNKIIFTNNKFFGFINWLINLNPYFYDRFLAFILPSIELKVTLKKRLKTVKKMIL